jgi:hypothetical protein
MLIELLLLDERRRKRSDPKYPLLSGTSRWGSCIGDRADNCFPGLSCIQQDTWTASCQVTGTVTEPEDPQNDPPVETEPPVENGTSSAGEQIDSPDACCTQDHRTCVTWCGQDKADCEACNA